jgi:hypothetical protein
VGGIGPWAAWSVLRRWWAASVWWRWSGRGAHLAEHYWCGPWAASCQLGCTVQWAGTINPFPLFRVLFQLISNDQISKIQNMNFLMSINFQTCHDCRSIQMEQVYFLAQLLILSGFLTKNPGNNSKLKSV